MKIPPNGALVMLTDGHGMGARQLDVDARRRMFFESLIGGLLQIYIVWWDPLAATAQNPCP